MIFFEKIGFLAFWVFFGGVGVVLASGFCVINGILAGR